MPWLAGPTTRTSWPRRSRPSARPAARVGLDVEAEHRRVVPRVEARARRVAGQDEPGRVHRPGGRLAQLQEPGQQLQHDLGLGVAAHGSEHRPQRAVGPGDRAPGPGCGAGAAGAVAGRMARRHGEADARGCAG